VIGWFREIALLAIVVAIFFSGRHMGRSEITALWNVEKAHTAEQIARQERDYASQLSAARDQALEDRRELDRIRAVPATRVLCHRSTPVPARPAAPDSAAAGDRTLSPAVEFDPTDGLYGLADEADDAVASCRAALATWPR
jgi:hypothetical protein